MAYTKLSYDYYNDRKNIVERLKKYKEPFAYTAEISLEAYEKAIEAVKVAADEKNAALEVADAKAAKYNALLEQEAKLLMALRACVGSDKGKNSDEFVAAGGTRQSDIVAQQQQAREDKKKAAEEEAKMKTAIVATSPSNA